MPLESLDISVFVIVGEDQCLIEGHYATVQRQNKENLKQIFPGKELRGYSPNSYIHFSVSDSYILYIPLGGLPILLLKIVGPNVGIYIDRPETHECGNWN
jgi:hypothetical protein